MTAIFDTLPRVSRKARRARFHKCSCLRKHNLALTSPRPISHPATVVVLNVYAVPTKHPSTPQRRLLVAGKGADICSLPIHQPSEVPTAINRTRFQPKPGYRSS